MKLHTDGHISMLHKSTGINSDAAYWTRCDDVIEGDYAKVDPPANWRELIAEADANTADFTGSTDPGEPEIWVWYEWDLVGEDGILTGESWLVGALVDDLVIEQGNDE